MDDLGTKIASYISSELASEGNGSEPLTSHTKLLGKVLDSLGLLALTTFLEEEFGIVLDDTDLDPKHFRTLEDVEALVRRKQEGS